MHAAARVTAGTRLVLAGFVDLRAPLRVRDLLSSLMRRRDAGFVCSSCREFRRPHLASNIRMLERAAHGASGVELLRRLAARRVALACDMDLGPVEDACRRFLARQQEAPARKGVAAARAAHREAEEHEEEEAAWRHFIARVLERGR